MSTYNCYEKPDNLERREPSEKFKQEIQKKYPYDPELREAIEDLCYLTYDELNVLYKMWEEKWIHSSAIFIKTYKNLFTSILPKTCSYQGRFSTAQLAEEIWKERERKRMTENPKQRLCEQKENIKKQIANLKKELSNLQNIIDDI